MRTARHLAIVTVIAAVSAPHARAGKVYPAWVIPDTLIVRSGPGTERDRIGTLTKGTKVYVTAFADNWCWAKLPDGRWGWLAEWLLQFSAEKGRKLAEEAGKTTSSASGGSSHPPAWIDAATVNVRSGPGTRYDTRGQLHSGTKVYIIDTEHDWCKCRTPGGYGWIRGDLLQRNVERGRELARAASRARSETTTDMQTAKAYVAGDGVRLRSGPGTNFTVKGSLCEGQVLYVTARRGEWYEARVHGGEDGWIHSSLVKFEGGTGSSTLTKGFVTGSRVHLRSGPSLNDHIKAKVLKGQTVFIADRHGDWYRVRVQDGEAGWIHSSLVKCGQEEPEAGAATATPEPAAAASGGSGEVLTAWIAEDIVNVRYGPGTDHGVKMKLSRGAKVKVLELSGHWCKIKDADGDTGWVAGWVMNFKGPGEDPTATEGSEEVPVRTAWVARPEVNVRSGPGTNHKEIGEAVLGTEVIILDRDGDWYHVALDNGTTGYMASWLLDTRAQRRARQGMGEPSVGAAPAASSIGQAFVDTAMKYLGYGYARGTAGPSTFDCSGFVHYVLGKHGVNVSRSSRAQYREGTPVSRGNLAIGDVVFFKNTYRSGISHVGLYIGDGKFIHASNRRGGVKISELDSGYYKPRYAGARRMR